MKERIVGFLYTLADCVEAGDNRSPIVALAIAALMPLIVLQFVIDSAIWIVNRRA